MPDAIPTRAPVIELFSSIQGEGAFIGERQVFLRLAGCPLRCAWCDTPGSWPIAQKRPARVHARGFERSAEPWMSAVQTAHWIDELDPSGALAISATGGEPLMWPAFLLELRAAVPHRRIHLETAGAHPRSLERVLDACDHVSLDLKLPADMQPPQELRLAEEDFEGSPRDEASWRAVRRACLALLAERDACAKVVVAGGRAAELFEPLFRDQAELAPRVPLVLQPATPVRGVEAPAQALLLALADRALELGLTPRVLPQVHPLLGLP